MGRKAARVPRCKTGIPVVELAFVKRSCERGLGELVRGPAEIAALIHRQAGCLVAEQVFTLGVTAAREPVALHRVGVGGWDQAMVDARAVLAGVLLSAAPSFVLIHTHPSGAFSPSQTDHDLTARVKKAAEAIGLKLLDHLIVARGGGYFSFMQAGLL